MTFALLIPAILCYLVMGAHFLRTGNAILVGLALAMPLLLLIRARFIMRAMQLILVLCAVEWVFTVLQLVDERKADGRDYLRGAAILAGVAAFNLIAAALFQTRKLKNHFSESPASRKTAFPSENPENNPH